MVAAKRGWEPNRDKNNTKLLIGTLNSGHLVGVSFSELPHNRCWTVNISARFGVIPAMCYSRWVWWGHSSYLDGTHSEAKYRCQTNKPKNTVILDY